MPNATTFNFMYDPGHAWLVVDGAQLAAAGFKPTDFSRYSYRGRNNLYYLEEDCDAPKFIKAWKERMGDITLNEVEDHIGMVRRLPPIW